MSSAIGAEPLGLAEAELAPLRAVMNGLVMPVFLASPSFREALEWARVGYSTRYLPMGYGLEPWAEHAARQARSRQAQREIRTRNGDWEKALPLLEPVLHAAALSWAETRGGALTSQDFAPLFQLLGLELTPHRRVALLRQLQGRGQLEETARKTWRVAPAWQTTAMGSVEGREAASVGLNLLVPTVFQRFNQVEGSVLSLRHLRLSTEGQLEFQRRLHGALEAVLSDSAPTERFDGSGLVALGVFDAMYPQMEQLPSGTELRPGLRDVCLTAVAEGLSRMGPWWVARDLVCRRFVQRVSESAGLTGVGLYRHLRERYAIRSANTVRAFQRGPSLELVSGRVGFNRGQIHEVATLARLTLAEAYPEELAERTLRARVEARSQIATLDVGVWTAALRRLEDDDVLRRIDGPGGLVFVTRRAEPQLMRSGHDTLEASAKVLLTSVVAMAEALNANPVCGNARALFRIVPRRALVNLRQQMLGTLDQLVGEVTRDTLRVSPGSEQQRGLTPLDVLLVARVMPLT